MILAYVCFAILWFIFAYWDKEINTKNKNKSKNGISDNKSR